MKFILLLSLIFVPQLAFSNSCKVKNQGSYTLCAEYTAPQNYIDGFKENCITQQNGTWSGENQCLEASHGCKIDTDQGLSVKIWYIDVESLEAIEFACRTMGAEIIQQ